MPGTLHTFPHLTFTITLWGVIRPHINQDCQLQVEKKKNPTQNGLSQKFRTLEKSDITFMKPLCDCHSSKNFHSFNLLNSTLRKLLYYFHFTDGKTWVLRFQQFYYTHQAKSCIFFLCSIRTLFLYLRELPTLLDSLELKFNSHGGGRKMPKAGFSASFASPMWALV